MRRVLLHGFTGGPASFSPIAGEAPALLGHAPQLVRPSSWPQEIDRLAALIAPHAPVHLAGYSLGARLALGVLVAHPELVARATLVGVNPGLDAAGRAVRAIDDAAWLRLLDAGIVPFVDAWEAQPLFATQARLPAEVRGRERARRLAHDPAGLSHALVALGLAAMPDLRPSLAGVRCPVALVAGEEDAKFRALAESTARALPGARLCVVPGAGHNVVVERPRELAALLEEDGA